MAKRAARSVVLDWWGRGADTSITLDKERTMNSNDHGAGEASPKERYETPVLRHYGAAAEVTQRVSMRGLPDGGPGNGNMSRTG
jgi:hypothetical protein